MVRMVSMGNRTNWIVSNRHDIPDLPHSRFATTRGRFIIVRDDERIKYEIL